MSHMPSDVPIAASAHTTTTITSTGRTSTGLQHVQGVNSTPDRRQFAVTTDDVAIFIDDTIDRTTAQCISSSPSALAILSPQRLPTHTTYVDVTDYDAEHIGVSSSVKKGRRSGSYLCGGGGEGSGHTSHSVRLSFGKSPTPKATRKSGGGGGSGGGSQNTSLCRATPVRDSTRRRLTGTPSPAACRPRSNSSSRRGACVCGGRAPLSDDENEEEEEAAAVPMVPLAELERVERERNRYEKMYEHQRALYEDMADKYAETYTSLQEKIVEVVALSTRNEESKKFIRQLKREMAESRTRVMDIQNRALEETRTERRAKSRYESLLDEQEYKYRRTMQAQETKMAGLESLLKDLLCMKSERANIHVSQLDALLKAAYAKSTSLFSDLLRQGRQIDLLYDSKDELERQIDQLRRDKRELEATLAEERRNMTFESERFIDQIEEQQQSILNLRQMLIRALDTAISDDDGDTHVEEEEEEDVEVEREVADEEEEERAGAGVAAHPRRQRDNANASRRRHHTAGNEEGDRNEVDEAELLAEEYSSNGRSSSENRTLAFLRSHMTSASRDGGNKENTTAAESTAATPTAETVTTPRPLTSNPVFPLYAAAAAAAAAAAVGAYQQRSSTNNDAPAEGIENAVAGATDSIFRPPQHKSTLYTSSKPPITTIEPAVSLAAKPSSSARTKKVSAKSQQQPTSRNSSDSSAGDKPLPPLKERDSSKNFFKTTTRSASSSSTHSKSDSSSSNTAKNATDVRHTQAYRIPRRANSRDSEEEGEGQGAAAAGASTGRSNGCSDDANNVTTADGAAFPSTSSNTAKDSAEGDTSAAAAPLSMRKRLDFTTALATVSAKREQERKARERALANNGNTDNNVSAGHGADKENQPQPKPSSLSSTTTLVYKQPLKQPLSYQGAADAEDDDDDVPRLVPQQVQQRSVLRTISQQHPEKT